MILVTVVESRQRGALPIWLNHRNTNRNNSELADQPSISRARKPAEAEHWSRADESRHTREAPPEVLKRTDTPTGLRQREKTLRIVVPTFPQPTRPGGIAMSLQLGIALNVVLVVLLIGGLAYLMAAPRHLKPHVQRFEQHVQGEIEHIVHSRQINVGAISADDQ